MADVDEFVFYDQVQFTKNDWRNRNLICDRESVRWLTIACRTSGKSLQSIGETEVANSRWHHKHTASILQSYSKSPGCDFIEEIVESCYSHLAGETSLSVINQCLIRFMAKRLGLRCKISDSRELSVGGNSTERLRAICQALNADTYVSGPAGKNYLVESEFRDYGIAVQYVDYTEEHQFLEKLRPNGPGPLSILDSVALGGVDAVGAFLA